MAIIGGVVDPITRQREEIRGLYFGVGLFLFLCFLGSRNHLGIIIIRNSIGKSFFANHHLVKFM